MTDYLQLHRRTEEPDRTRDGVKLQCDEVRGRSVAARALVEIVEGDAPDHAGGGVQAGAAVRQETKRDVFVIPIDGARQSGIAAGPVGTFLLLGLFGRLQVGV